MMNLPEYELVTVPTGESAFVMPVLRCFSDKCEGVDRPTYRTSGVVKCGVCTKPISRMSPIEEYLSRNISAAVIEATRAPGWTPEGTGLTPPSFHRKDCEMSVQPTDATTSWRDLKPGVVIYRDPAHPDVLGEWEVLGIPNTNGWDVFTHVRCPSGCERTFHTFQDTKFATRPVEQPERAS